MGRLLLLSMFFVSLSIQAQECPTVEDKTQSFCAASEPTVGELEAAGEGIFWLNSDGDLLIEETLLVDGESYFATAESCEVSIEVQVKLDQGPVAGRTTTVWLCSDSDPVNLQELILPINNGPYIGWESQPGGDFEPALKPGPYTFDPSQYSVEDGVPQIKYFVTNSCGTDDTIVYVNLIKTPSAGEGGIIDIPYDAEMVELSTYLSPEATPGGEWTDAEGNEIVGGNFNPTIHAEGNYTYTVSVSQNTSGAHYLICDNSAIYSVNIHEPVEDEKVLVCHKGKTLEIDKDALQAHLDHGDAEGECGASTASKTIVYPNPSKGEFNFSNKTVDILNIKIFNFDGELVEEFEVAGNSSLLEVNLGQLRKGIYFAEVLTANGKEVLRLIKK